MTVEFAKQEYGAVVATILETPDSIVEVQQRNDGKYGLIVHTRRADSDKWDDLTAYLRPQHFAALGLVAYHMRGEVPCCRGLAPTAECKCALESEHAEGTIEGLKARVQTQRIALIQAMAALDEISTQVEYYKKNRTSMYEAAAARTDD